MNNKRCQSGTLPQSALRRGVIAGSVVLLGACSSVTGARFSEGELRIEPTATSVAFTRSETRIGFTVPITITNHSSTTIYLADSPCAFAFERSAGGNWIRITNRIVCTMDRRPPFAIQPGQSRNVDARLFPDPDSVTGGQYRVVLPLSVQVNGNFRKVSEEFSASLPFTVMASP